MKIVEKIDQEDLSARKKVKKRDRFNIKDSYLKKV